MEHKLTKELSFKEPELIGNFLTINYKKRIECIDNAEDKYMRKHLVNWIRMIENDGIDHFSTSLISHFYHMISSYDLFVPLNKQDTVLYSVLALRDDSKFIYTYQSTVQENVDSSFSYFFTDDIEGTSSIASQLSTSFYEAI